MNERNRDDLNREQRGASNSNPNERPENRSTKQGETDRMGGTTDTENLGVGDSDRDRNLGNESEGAGNRSTGNIEGDENLNRR
jgi:hypothetical protein